MEAEKLSQIARWSSSLSAAILSLREIGKRQQTADHNDHETQCVDVLGELPPAEAAQCAVTTAFGLASMFFVRLRCQGIDHSEHPLKQDLDRIKAHLHRLKEKIHGRERPPMRIDQQAAERIVRFYTAEDAEKGDRTVRPLPEHQEETPTQTQKEDDQEKTAEIVQRRGKKRQQAKEARTKEEPVAKRSKPTKALDEAAADNNQGGVPVTIVDPAEGQSSDVVPAVSKRSKKKQKERKTKKSSQDEPQKPETITVVSDESSDDVKIIGMVADVPKKRRNSTRTCKSKT